MALGRCAGCGITAPSRQVKIHVLGCVEYLALHRTTPERCLDPEADYLRHKQETDTPEARARRRDSRLRERFQDLDEQYDRQQKRWATPADFLDD